MKIKNIKLLVVLMKNMEKLRKSKNLSKTAFCSLLNINTSTYYKWLKLQSQPRLNHFYYIYRNFNVGLDELIKEYLK